MFRKIVVLEKLKMFKKDKFALPEKCPYSEFFWSAFSRIRTGYWVIRSISPSSVQMPQNMKQKNSEYGHFLRSTGYN